MKLEEEEKRTIINRANVSQNFVVDEFGYISESEEEVRNKSRRRKSISILNSYFKEVFKKTKNNCQRDRQRKEYLAKTSFKLASIRESKAIIYEEENFWRNRRTNET